METKNENIFSVLEITASELVALNFSIKKRILVFGTQCGNKHSKDFAYH